MLFVWLVYVESNITSVYAYYFLKVVKRRMDIIEGKSAEHRKIYVYLLTI